MKKLALWFTITIFSAGLIACAKQEISNSSNLAANQPSENSNAKIADSMQLVAYHFEKKLQTYEGKLNSLVMDQGDIYAEWDSKKCDSLKVEVIDLAICVNRGYKDSVKSINVQRTCDSNPRKFSISGDKYNQYKTGKIGDPQFTEGIE